MKWQIEEHETLSSTQDALKALALTGAVEGACVQALQQESGRGRHGREWISPPGNLYISILLKPDCSAAEAGQISFVAALAVAKAIAAYMNEALFLKWPNDVFLAGKKCAGILLESDIEKNKINWLALGIGVNISSAPPEGNAVGKQVDVNAFRDTLLKHLEHYYALWRDEGFEKIRTEWLALAHPVETKIAVKSGSNSIEGKFRDIDADGNLLLEDAQRNIRRISAGDVLLTGT
jgi:BirA family biotin operon repressor/biotin-[acetyl-CoA-carboxylase] ligase